LDPSRPVWPWLRTVASHIATDSVRRASRELLIEPDEDTAKQGVEIESSEERLILREALSRLPPRQRLAIALHYFEDRPQSTSAEMLGLDRGAFKQLLFRARRSLDREYRRVLGEMPALLPILGRLPRRIRRIFGGRRTECAMELAGRIGGRFLSFLPAGDVNWVNALGQAAAVAALVTSVTFALQGHAFHQDGAPTAGSPAASQGESNVGPQAEDRYFTEKGQRLGTQGVRVWGEEAAELFTGEEARRESFDSDAFRAEAPLPRHPKTESDDESCQCAGISTDLPAFIKDYTRAWAGRLRSALDPLLPPPG
jgi:hypothetical protein